MLEFQWPWLFLLLPLPLAIWFFAPAKAQQQAALKAPLLERLNALNKPSQQTVVARHNYLKLALAFAIWALLVSAAARPHWLGDPIPLPTLGRDLMLAIDVSGSMEERDAQLRGQKVSRLVAVQAAAGEFIERREGDRLGLILFGDQAYLQTPLTYDRSTVKTMLYEASVGLAGKRTAIGDAIGLGVKRLETVTGSDRILILLTDGTNTAGQINPQKAAELASTLGVRIHTIAFGSEPPRGGFFPQVSSIDTALLKQVAETTGGQFFRARNSGELEAIYGLIDELEPIEGESRSVRPQQALFYWPLAIAFALTLLWFLLGLLASSSLTSGLIFKGEQSKGEQSRRPQGA